MSDVKAFRFAQRKRGASRWIPVDDRPDTALARDGWELAGPAVDPSNLPGFQAERLRAILGDPHRTDEQESWAKRMLARCDRINHLPPLDLDPQQPGCRLPEMVPAVRAISRELYRVGLGVPRWCFSGGSGIHGGLVLPLDHPSDPDLLRAVLPLVREAARRAGIPLLSEHRSKDARPGLRFALDDTLWQRSPEGRQVVWTLEGADKGKVPLEQVLTDHDIPEEVPVHPRSIARAIENWRSKARKKEARRRKRLDVLGGTIGRHAQDGPPSSDPGWKRVETCAVCGKSRCMVHEDGWIRCWRSGGRTTRAPKQVNDRPDDRPRHRKVAEVLFRHRERVPDDVLKRVWDVAPPRRPTPRERHHLIRAADQLEEYRVRLVGRSGRLGRHPVGTRQNHLRRAASCGLIHEHRTCAQGHPLNAVIYDAERAACWHCALQRATNTVAWLDDVWDRGRYFVAFCAHPGTPDEVREAAEPGLRAVRRTRHGNDARHLTTPKGRLYITRDLTAVTILSRFGWRSERVDKSGALARVAVALLARANHLDERIHYGDPDLPWDPWLGHVRVVGGSRDALPWPTLDDLRKLLEPDQDEDHHDCGCPACEPVERYLVWGPTGRIIGHRNDRPWGYGEAAREIAKVEPDAGWLDRSVKTTIETTRIQV